ncbi:MAG TPA: hypothetical protein PKM43_00640 [Verrucomicrobiota bacterium]|nr:hypothetical protein [Verrucomicrobiota bacterium]HRZ36103.1 hypothetical protein [Candidatus Paceibacterota bacterium]HRZ54961.1 hypothetical protein [Candidatus Paceibacterota bacterium]
MRRYLLAICVAAGVLTALPFITTTNTSTFQWTLRGQPVRRQIHWLRDSLNLVGFGLPTSGTPRFDTFFAGEPALGDFTLFRLDTQGRWVPTSGSALMQPGEAFWIRTRGLPAFQGPIQVQLDRRVGLDFGRILTEQKLRLYNASPSPRTIAVRLLQSQPPPVGSGTALAGDVPFAVKLIVHLDAAGQARLLQKVVQVWLPGTYRWADDGSGHLVADQPGRFVLLTDDSLAARCTGAAMEDNHISVHPMTIAAGDESRRAEFPPSPTSLWCTACDRARASAGQFPAAEGRGVYDSQAGDALKFRDVERGDFMVQGQEPDHVEFGSLVRGPDEKMHLGTWDEWATPKCTPAPSPAAPPARRTRGLATDARMWWPTSRRAA